jgi:hypothetical protein
MGNAGEPWFHQAGASVIAPRLAVETSRMYFASRPRV